MNDDGTAISSEGVLLDSADATLVKAAWHLATKHMPETKLLLYRIHHCARTRDALDAAGHSNCYDPLNPPCDGGPAEELYTFFCDQDVDPQAYCYAQWMSGPIAVCADTWCVNDARLAGLAFGVREENVTSKGWYRILISAENGAHMCRRSHTCDLCGKEGFPSGGLPAPLSELELLVRNVRRHGDRAPYWMWTELRQHLKGRRDFTFNRTDAEAPRVADIILDLDQYTRNL